MKTTITLGFRAIGKAAGRYRQVGIVINARLRLAVNNAKGESLPKDVIERAIKKASGGDAESYEEIRYEGFGPSGVGLIVEALTDNRNRAAANVRSIFTKNGGNLGESGSVSFMWDRVGQIGYAAAAGSEDQIMEAAIEAGADDVESDEDNHTIYTAFDQLSEVAAALEAALGAAKSTNIVWRPRVLTPVGGDAAATLMKMLEALDDDDDVQHVYSNADISAEDLEKLAG